MNRIPTFETDRLTIRGIALSDVPAYERHFIDYEVISHLSSDVPWPYPADGVRDFLESVALPRQGKSHWLWGLALRASPGEIIGAIELWREGRPEQRGFWLGRAHWGKGLMTEAVAPVMDYAFDVLGFESLTFANAVGNTRSRRIKEKTGARFLRVEPASFVNPDVTESEVWELTKDDWSQRRRQGLV